MVGEYVYLGFEDGTLAAFDVGTGDLRWRVGLPGPVGALAPAGDLLLAPTVGVTGGLIAYAHAADRPLVRMRSPTILRLGTAVLSFAAAAAVLLAGLPPLFGFLSRARSRAPLPRGSRLGRRLGGR
jgi:hypothetical protein